MGISISSSLSTASYAAENSSANAAAAHRPQPPASHSGNTAKPTESQQVVQLYNQGQQVSQIATSLSLPVEQVNSYLGITGGGGG